MKHLRKKKILGRKIGPRKALLRSLAINLVLYEKMRTTKAKAKAVRPIVEKMITVGKKNTLHSRRKLLQFFNLENPVRKILEVLGPRYLERKGGYLRIVSLGRRKGDGAEMAVIEFV